MSGNHVASRHSGVPLPYQPVSESVQSTPSVTSATPEPAATISIGEVGHDPAGSLSPKGWKDLPTELRDLVFDNFHGAARTGWDQKKLSTTFGIPLQQLPAQSKLQVAAQVRHDVFETAEKLNLHPHAVLANIANSRERLSKLAIALGSVQGEDLQDKLAMFCAASAEGESRRVHPALGFQGEDEAHASQLLNAPLHVLHDEMATREAQTAAVTGLNAFMRQSGRPAHEAVLSAWMQRAGQVSDNNLAVLQHYLAYLYSGLPRSGERLKKIVDEMADVRPGKDFQHIASLFKRQPDRPTEIAFSFSLNREDQEKANQLLAAPLSLLSALDKDPSRDPMEMLKDQKDALKKIKSEIGKMRQPSQAAAREVMLVGLSHRLKELGSDELKLEAVQFLKDYWNAARMDDDRFDHNGGVDHQQLIFDNMLGLVRGMDNMRSSSIRRRLLDELSQVPNVNSKITPDPVAHDARESMLHELTESFVGFKKGKRKAIELVGNGIRSKTITQVNEGAWFADDRITKKADISAATQVQLLGRMLDVAGDIHSVETQRQILLEFSKTINDKDLLDANSKKELAILLGKAIPNFHFSRLDSGRNMQHKAYKLFRGLIQERYTDVSSYGYLRGYGSDIRVNNPTRFSDSDMAEIIAAVADSLPQQSTTKRPGTRNHTELLRTGHRLLAAAGSPISLALTPVTPSRPPIRDSLVNNMLGTLENYRSKPTYGKLDATRDRIPAWTSLIKNNHALDAEHRHKVVERFLATVTMRDQEIDNALGEIYSGISIHHANVASEIAALDAQANLEIAKLRDADPLAITTWLKSLERDREQGENLLLPLKTQHPVLPPHLDRSQQALQYRMLPPGPLPADRAEELVERVKARRAELVIAIHERAADAAMDRIVSDYAARHETDLQRFQADPEARINGMRIEEFKEATRPAMEQAIRLHAGVEDRLAAFNVPIDHEIALLRSAKQEKSKLNLVGKRKDQQQIDELEKSKAAERWRLESEAAQALAAIQFPHLQRYKTDFTPAFEALAEVLPALEKTGLRDRVTAGLAQHNQFLPDERRIALPEEAATSADTEASRA